jgi:triosephosphate isomerase
MRAKIIAANWKMNKGYHVGLTFAQALVRALEPPTHHSAQIILLPPFIHLSTLSQTLAIQQNIHLGAQNCHQDAYGAFTGEIAAPMLRSVGAQYVLVGHSERRQLFNEDNRLLAKKVTAALPHALKPIFCCGESAETRAEGGQEAFVKQQLVESLFHLTAQQIAQVIIAYEPIWAIGTGKTATPTEVQAMHQAIRSMVTQQYGEAIGQDLPILYGGSCNAQNAHVLFSCPDVDGGLIGKASLEVASFVPIVNALNEVAA